MINKKFILLLIAVFICKSEFAQDIHFSQYYASPLTLSPSNTGNYNGNSRIMSNYRSQWKEISKPYITNSIGYDRQFYIFNEKFSGGFIIVNDKSGINLKVLKILASAAYHKKIERNIIHAGIQFGLVNKQVTPPDETFPNQLNWETGHFDKTLPNNENELQNKLKYFDFNMGFGWNFIQLKKIEPFFSFAIFHLNCPNESFNNDKFILKPRLLFSGGTKWFFSDVVTFIPRFSFMRTTKANELNLGFNTNFKTNNGDAKTGPTSLFSGIHTRTGINNLNDAVFLVLGVIFNRVEVGVSYDINVSKLHVATNYQGGFEISLIWTGLSTHITKKEIPCDRY
ncbi:MAG: PorP/SprF family type IX secretion system membrane protein [Bacteroidales bacterium]|jgi:type IX secretion system PorP/SprF family membrane protein